MRSIPARHGVNDRLTSCFGVKDFLASYDQCENNKNWEKVDGLLVRDISNAEASVYDERR